MDKNIAIEFDGVGKQYRLGLVGTGSLQHDLNRWWQTAILRKEDPYLKIGEINDRSKKGTSDYVWALKDISFKVEQGDVVGIIGKNGAGKSTLLKLLSHITAPSVGHIRYRGRIASLLEVGTGFHPEMTARQNIYMNGSIMGMTRHEITSKLDEIVDFAGIERYLDTPVKRFSSGMTVRLGFAVAAFLEPEILVVDEVLAVGDAEFQKKAIGKMKDVSSQGGRTVLFVSHNMAAVRSLCNHGIVLKNGMIDFMGTIDDSVDHYIQNVDINKNDKITNHITYHKHTVNISKVIFNDSEYCVSMLSSEQLYVDVTIKGYVSEPIHTDLMVIFKNKNQTPMATLADGHIKGRLLEIPEGEFSISKRIFLPKYVAKGSYYIDIYMHHPMIEYQLKIENGAELQIEGYQEGFGRAMILSEEGFLGLESEDLC